MAQLPRQNRVIAPERNSSFQWTCLKGFLKGFFFFFLVKRQQHQKWTILCFSLLMSQMVRQDSDKFLYTVQGKQLTPLIFSTAWYLQNWQHKAPDIFITRKSLIHLAATGECRLDTWFGFVWFVCLGFFPSQWTTCLLHPVSRLMVRA